MSASKYTFSIQDAFPNHKVASDRLVAEIRASAIIIAVDYINTSGDDCDIWFKDALSPTDEAVLAGLVAAHQGEPLPDNTPVLITTAVTSSAGTALVAMDCPCEQDRKPVMVNSPATEGTFTWLSSKGDNLTPIPPSSGRGDGQQLLLVWTADPGEPATKEVEIQFIEPVELHDGHVSWRGAWDFEDSWGISVRMPATVTTPNPTNEGNCNLFDTGQGFNIVLPAAGDGTHDVDLEQAVPIPDGYNKKTGKDFGFWDVDQRWTETITPNAEAQGEFNLYDIPLEMFFCKNMDTGNPLGIWDLDAYKAEWISKKWRLCFQCTKATPGAGKLGGYFMIFRPGAI